MKVYEVLVAIHDRVEGIREEVEEVVRQLEAIKECARLEGLGYVKRLLEGVSSDLGEAEQALEKIFSVFDELNREVEEVGE